MLARTYRAAGPAAAQERKARYAATAPSKPAAAAATVTPIPETFELIEEAIANRIRTQGGEKGVIRFMLAMARDKQAPSPNGIITMQALQNVWTNKTDSQKIEDAFRAARPNEHEWIPSNLMVEVIGRAQSSQEGEAWIHLQDLLRSMTGQVIFKPQFWTMNKSGTAMYPNGHVGALEQWFEPGAPGPKYVPLQVGMEQFHDELRVAFRGAHTTKDAVTALQAVFRKWVWNGELPAGNVKIAPDAYFHREHMNDPLVAFDLSADHIAQAKANYAAMDAKFTGISAEVAQALKDDATRSAPAVVPAPGK